MRPEDSASTNTSEYVTEFLSFTKVRKLAKNFSFLVLDQADGKLVELSDKNLSFLIEGVTLILIKKEFVKLKLAIENKTNNLDLRPVDDQMMSSASELMADDKIEEDKTQTKEIAEVSSSSSDSDMEDSKPLP